MILGIDPGLATIGYGIIEKGRKGLTPVEYGSIITEPKLKLPERLEIIHSRLSEIIEKYPIKEAAIENLYFSKNVKTAMVVGHARGVLILTVRIHRIPVFEYTPNQIKSAITGYGSAGKKQIQRMVTKLLNLKEIPRPDDTADALACAICHYNSRGLLKQIKKSKAKNV